MNVLKEMIKQTGFESLTIIIDTTNIDRSEAMVLNIIEQMEQEEKPVAEIENYKKVQLPRIEYSRSQIGTFAKTLRAITGASIVLTTLQENSFDAKSGNLGMQKNHDYQLVDLRNSNIFGLKQ